MITPGTGVGCDIVINGQMVYGHDGFAGELGHVIVRRENGRMCGCGRKGCLEGVLRIAIFGRRVLSGIGRGRAAPFSE